jgi:ABC-2 type transport system ATP-binding protein
VSGIALEIHALKKSFGETEAVRGVNLTISRGEMFGLVGPDGAGKTTLIRMLCGIIKPDGGSAKILGFDLATQIKEIKPRIGYLSQRFSLYPDLSIDENIEFFAEIHEVKDYAARRNELLDFTRLTPFRKRLADKLSGGMKQKLALAATLIHKPEIIFLDEPTTGVDPVSRREFWKILSSLLDEGITILMTTPYLDEAERCTRVGLMSGGHILLTDTPKNVKKQMIGSVIEIIPGLIDHLSSDLDQITEALRSNPEILEIQTFGDRINAVMKKGIEPEKIQKWLESKGVAVRSARTIQPSLENVFIALLRDETGSGTDRADILEKESANA